MTDTRSVELRPAANGELAQIILVKRDGSREKVLDPMPHSGARRYAHWIAKDVPGCVVVDRFQSHERAPLTECGPRSNLTMNYEGGA